MTRLPVTWRRPRRRAVADVGARLALLDTERRKLLEKLLRDKGGTPPPSPVSPPSVLTFVPDGDSPRRADPEGTVKAGFVRFYNAVTEQLDSTEAGEFSFFLNYGYSPDLNPQHAVIKLPARYINKNSVQLVLEVVGGHDVRGQRILDVGCGRGGTVYVLKEFFHPISINGLDLCPKAVEFCRRRHRYPDVRFDVGDAERLAFPDGAFDAVTNIESSHAYPDIRAFYDGVRRVLARDGAFLYADCLPAAALADNVRHLVQLGFVAERETDITSNVLKSCDEIAQTRVTAFQGGNDPELMANFLAVPGSEVYDQMKSRRWRYMIYRFRKRS
jgi:ubiquinone/menaquinone biosynthesis C-methylase UbiE